MMQIKQATTLPDGDKDNPDPKSQAIRFKPWPFKQEEVPLADGIGIVWGTGGIASTENCFLAKEEERILCTSRHGVVIAITDNEWLNSGGKQFWSDDEDDA